MCSHQTTYQLLRNRNNQVYFRTKMLKFSSDTEKCIYPILNDSIQIVSRLWYAQNVVWTSFLVLSERRSTKVLLHTMEKGGQRADQQICSNTRSQLTALQIGVTFSFSSSCKDSRKVQEYHCYLYLWKPVYVQGFRNSKCLSFLDTSLLIYFKLM